MPRLTPCLTRRQLIATAAHAPLLLAAPALAQADVPEDAQMDQVYQAMTDMVAWHPVMGPMLGTAMEAQRSVDLTETGRGRLVMEMALW